MNRDKGYAIVEEIISIFAKHNLSVNDMKNIVSITEKEIDARATISLFEK